MDLLQETPADHINFLRSSHNNVHQFDSMMVDANETGYYPLVDEFTHAAPIDTSIATSTSQQSSTMLIAQVKPEPVNWTAAAVVPPSPEATITLLAPVPRRRGRPRKQASQPEAAPAVIAVATKAEPRNAVKVAQISMNSSEDSDEETEPSSGDKNSKNREAAQQFRHRQREHIKHLETQVSKYAKQNETFNFQVERLQDENRLARQQVQMLREFINQAMSFAFSNLSQSILEQQLEQMKAQLGQLPAVQAQIQRFHHQPAVTVAQS